MSRQRQTATVSHCSEQHVEAAPLSQHCSNPTAGIALALLGAFQHLPQDSDKFFLHSRCCSCSAFGFSLAAASVFLVLRSNNLASSSRHCARDYWVRLKIRVCRLPACLIFKKSLTSMLRADFGGKLAAFVPSSSGSGSNKPVSHPSRSVYSLIVSGRAGACLFPSGQAGVGSLRKEATW